MLPLPQFGSQTLFPLEMNSFSPLSGFRDQKLNQGMVDSASARHPTRHDCVVFMNLEREHTGKVSHLFDRKCVLRKGGKTGVDNALDSRVRPKKICNLYCAFFVRIPAKAGCVVLDGSAKH